MPQAPPSPARFALRFLVLFAALTTAFEFSRGTVFERFLVEDLVLRPTTALINRLSSADGAVLSGRTITSAGTSLRITRGCEGVEMLLMLAAGILAYPAGWGGRARGLLWGALLAYGLSVVRILALHYILRYQPQAWGSLHGMILPLLPIVAIAVYFMRWSAGIAGVQRDAATDAA